ncbi:hypothetical protein [Streptomyces apocyni]|uniref:hypothetical protein n=1 Tax=Streptomyces apocyni TaxID=2654677 RepID=UPI0012EA7DB8|nr:hypothetical protein [Streptomyces apocyni]
MAVADHITCAAPRGRHRAGPQRDGVRRPVVVRQAVRTRPRPGPYATDTPLDGHASAPVRPYLLTPEQRRRRRALWLTTYGVDVGPRRTHGVEVAAR